jgi:hypothetical protein
MSERLTTTESQKATNLMFLTREELTLLTGRRQRVSQAQALRAMGIQHRIRPDGHIVVLRRHVELLFGVEAERRTAVEPMPDWSAAKWLRRGTLRTEDCRHVGALFTELTTTGYQSDLPRQNASGSLQGVGRPPWINRRCEDGRRLAEALCTRGRA